MSTEFHLTYGHEFTQTLIKWSGAWRLYLNTPMRKAAKKEVGDMADFEIAYDLRERVVPMHPKFEKALLENKEAKKCLTAYAHPYNWKSIAISVF